MTTSLPRIHISDNRRFLVTADGKPFFWMADTAWELFHRLSLAEAAQYLDNRHQKGFTVIQAVILAEHDGLRDPTPAGEVPLIDMDPARPNPAYFDTVETMIQMAAERGLYIGLLPTWGDKVNLAWGKGPQIFDAESARAYGHFVGQRFRDHDNIIWVNGGDRREVENGVDYRPVWRALAAGVKAEAGQIMTYHPLGSRGSSLVFHTDDWLDFNMWQSSHGALDVPIWEHITADYAREPVKPVLDGEPCYEDITIQFNPANGAFTPYDVRRQMYRAVFAGACGQTYGHNCVWQMFAPGREPAIHADRPWTEALDRPAAGQVIHLRNLMLSRPYLTRIPDQELLIGDPGTGNRHMRATRDAAGAYALIYVPDSYRRFTVDMRRLAGEVVNAQWYDPRTGAWSPAGRIATGGPHTFESPPQGPDNVLVLDSPLIPATDTPNA